MYLRITIISFVTFTELIFRQKKLPNLIENEVVKKIAKKYNKNPSHVLLRFLVEKKIVPIPKSVTPSRIRDNIKIFDFMLNASDIKELEALEIGEEARIVDFHVLPQ